MMINDTTFENIVRNADADDGRARAVDLLLLGDSYQVGFHRVDIDYAKACECYLALLDCPHDSAWEEGRDRFFTMLKNRMVYADQIPASIHIESCRRLAEVSEKEEDRFFLWIEAIHAARKGSGADPSDQVTAAEASELFEGAEEYGDVECDELRDLYFKVATDVIRKHVERGE